MRSNVKTLLCKKFRFKKKKKKTVLKFFVYSGFNLFSAEHFSSKTLIQSGFEISFPALKCFINVSQCVFYECFHNSLQNLKLS